MNSFGVYKSEKRYANGESYQDSGVKIGRGYGG
jgi:hypothetical protein